MTAEYSGLYVCTAKLQKPPLSTHAEVIVTLAPDVWFSQKFRHLCISEGFPSKSITFPCWMLKMNTLSLTICHITQLTYHYPYLFLDVVKKPVITGNTTIKDGDDLNLTCSVESFPPSVITWTKHGSIKNLLKETKIILHNDTGTATLIIPNVTVEFWTVLHPRILSTSGCVVQSEVLTCVCVSEGFPLPTIKWPLLDTHTEYSVTTNFSNHAVHISITVLRKQKNSEEIAETLEMISAGEAVQNDGTQDEEAAEGGAVAPPNDDGLLKRKCPNGPEATKETTETEYAEVKRKGERQDDGGWDGEKVEGNEEEEVMLVGDKEVEQCMSAEEVEGGMADVFRSLNLIETLKESIDHNKLSEVKDALEDLLISRINLALIGDRGDEKASFINSLNGLSFGDDGAAPSATPVAPEEVACYPNPKHPDFRLWDLPPVPSTSPFEPEGYMNTVKFPRYNAVFITFTQTPQTNSVRLFLEAQSLQQQTVYFILFASEKCTEKSLEEKRKTSLEVLRSQVVTMLKVYVVRPSALEKFDFPGLLQDMERDLPEIRAHAVLLALPTLTSSLVTQKKDAFKALVWAAASLSGGVSAIPVPFVASMVDSSVAVRILTKAQLSLCLDDESVERLARQRGMEPTRLKGMRTCALSVEVTKGEFNSAWRRHKRTGPQFL
ncbi:hypothetical protein F7725_018197 [Dissostichus mawsoni]|uniref:Uncharacterized protein n=1 Tax=Dissostichus mawsoni TaxID=36200 RepID=A0A7J5XQY9_DISMA|nr:hypothetical protein F7725_018197 [Dissostichus mawsoni]